VPMQELVDLMARLRDPERGCPWDLDQTFSSLARYTLEEAYEVVDCLERGDLPALKEELGDLLLQVVFHSQIAREQGAFDFEAVVRGICDKLIRRHPHVFGDVRVGGAEEQSRLWEDQKLREREAAGKSVLDGLPHALPALPRATKLGQRAAQLGFDWPSPDGARAKIGEELAELDAATRAGDREEVAVELGDLLLAISSLARHLNVDPESALRAANRRFERRFRHVEERRRAAGSADLEQLEAWWVEAKDAERSGG
jgi:nucleoside triphosphate diphosphatase